MLVSDGFQNGDHTLMELIYEHLLFLIVVAKTTEKVNI